jgi:hypothetical protein
VQEPAERLPNDIATLPAAVREAGSAGDPDNDGLRLSAHRSRITDPMTLLTRERPESASVGPGVTLRIN